MQLRASQMSCDWYSRLTKVRISSFQNKILMRTIKKMHNKFSPCIEYYKIIHQLLFILACIKYYKRIQQCWFISKWNYPTSWRFEICTFILWSSEGNLLSKMNVHNSLSIASPNCSCSWIPWGVCSLTTLMILCARSNFGFNYNSTSIIHINLLTFVSIWKHNILCNKQQIMKTFGKKNTCNSNLVRNPLNVFLRIPKVLSTIECPCLCLVLYNSSKTIWWPSSLNGVMIQVISG